MVTRKTTSEKRSAAGRKGALARGGKKSGSRSKKTTRAGGSKPRVAAKEVRAKRKSRKIEVSDQDVGYGKNVEKHFERPVNRRSGAEARWESMWEKSRVPYKRTGKQVRTRDAEQRWERNYEEGARRKMPVEKNESPFGLVTIRGTRKRRG